MQLCVSTETVAGSIY